VQAFGLVSRPSADVVLPFAGTAAELRAALERLERLELRAGDTATLVDNTPGSDPLPARATTAAGSDALRVLAAPEVRSSYFARERGAAGGSAEWIVFVDADTRFGPDLLDRLLDPPPAGGVGVVAGGVADEVVADTAVARSLLRREAMSQSAVTGRDRPYALTAHCAVRRSAYEQVGGFDTTVRSGGDADLCFRLAGAGWALEERAGAVVLHAARSSLRAAVRQVARHGSGAAWVDRRHPGTFPARRPAGLLAWSARRLATAAACAARGDRDGALDASLDPLLTWAFEAGRRIPNRAPRG
jgi:GT2 family glycosyltransferase